MPCSIKVLTTSFFLALAAGTANAGVCDYKPSETVGEVGAKLTSVTAAATGVASEYFKSYSNYYLIRHASDGINRLGSTRIGDSAARTAGILKNSKWGAKVFNFVTRPKVTIASFAVVGVVEGYEVACGWFAERH